MYNFFAVCMIIGFMGYAVYWIQNHNIDSFDIQNFGNLFIAGAIFCVGCIVLQVYSKKIVDRMLLGAALFASIGSLIFVLGNTDVEYHFNMYIQIIPFVCLFIVGVITTFHTPSGFIGESSTDIKAVRYASLKLLVVVILGGLWALYIKQHLNHRLFYFLLPLWILFALRDRWSKQLRGEKVFSYSIKW